MLSSSLPLLPLTGEKLPPGSNLSDGARLDVSCINLWSPLSRAFRIRIYNNASLGISIQNCHKIVKLRV